MKTSRKTKWFILIALLVSLFIGFIVSPFASTLPDGMEKVAIEKGFMEKGEGWQAWNNAPFPDYETIGLGGGITTGLAGLVGTLSVFVTAYAVANIIKLRRKDKRTKESIERLKG